MRTVIVGVLCLLTSWAMASVNVSGTFLVTSGQCPAYVSKNKKTNPDQLSIYRNQSYDLKEINRPSSPDWFRINVPGNANALRWVSGSCGDATYNSQPTQCEQLPGKANSYLLALSWQPGFCQTYGYEAGKPECHHLRSDSFASSHFTLHGLWPNQNACGINYGFCASRKKPKLCDYSPLQLSSDVGEQLAIVMPSYAEGSCLERHEWNKHGTCQLLGTDDYFSQAMNLASQVNASTFRQFIAQNIGAKVSHASVLNEFEKSFGPGSSDKLHLTCTANTLVDVYISLPVLIQTQNDLKALLAADIGRTETQWGCGEQFSISDFVAD